MTSQWHHSKMSLCANDLMLYRPIYSATDHICWYWQLRVWSDDDLLIKMQIYAWLDIYLQKKATIPVAPHKSKQACMESWCTPTRVWVTNFHSELVYGSQWSKWVYYTKRCIPLLILYHSCKCTWLISIHIWSTQHLYETPTNKDSSESAEVCT